MPSLFSSFLLFLSFFFWGGAFAKELRSSTAYLCEKTKVEGILILTLNHPPEETKRFAREREREREVRVRVRV
jgi:hypothetical protein